jgi:hypothetical protein
VTGPRPCGEGNGPAGEDKEKPGIDHEVAHRGGRSRGKTTEARSHGGRTRPRSEVARRDCAMMRGNLAGSLRTSLRLAPPRQTANIKGRPATAVLCAPTPPPPQTEVRTPDGGAPPRSALGSRCRALNRRIRTEIAEPIAVAHQGSILMPPALDHGGQEVVHGGEGGVGGNRVVPGGVAAGLGGVPDTGSAGVQPLQFGDLRGKTDAAGVGAPETEVIGEPVEAVLLALGDHREFLSTLSPICAWVLLPHRAGECRASRAGGCGS